MEMVKKGPGEACANNYPPQTTFFHGTLNKATVHTVSTSQHRQARSTATLKHSSLRYASVKKTYFFALSMFF